jgi:hypothetical protein
MHCQFWPGKRFGTGERKPNDRVERFSAQPKAKFVEFPEFLYPAPGHHPLLLTRYPQHLGGLVPQRTMTCEVNYGCSGAVLPLLWRICLIQEEPLINELLLKQMNIVRTPADISQLK